MNDTKSVTSKDATVSKWKKEHKKHHKSKLTPMSRNSSWGPSAFGTGNVNDPDNDGDNDVTGGDTDNDAQTQT